MPDDEDEYAGISIRFIQQFKPFHDGALGAVDLAIYLASCDDRDLPFDCLLDDAMTFIKSHPHLKRTP